MSALKAIIYNCRKATYLTDKRMAGKITFKEHIELRIHLYGCAACRLYVKQSGKINEMIKALLKSPAANNIRLDDDFKNRMQVTINDELNKN
ncbi:hypothetical protein IDJ77_07770 [Mucilaginibacter sp. ZT4R22]|uniref:Zinc finger protein n=1 Tax=Mucilaginibacter pankratovii TaxID=2772110 RepID=A0ABR7WN18_9SPHI|nr:hypothetical protein [Mucilaginibacter pankratovii]MBD1363704.1 hypothetical protein [Mucilaginibacter pankratovii]